MKTSRFFLLMVVLSFFSCSDENDKLTKDQILRVVENAQETLLIGENSFKLEAYIWRDFMPTIGEAKRGMISINWLVSTDPKPIPSNIKMVKQYVTYQNEIWDANYENEVTLTYLYKIERISRNGPEWETGISVTVISQIYDSETKTNYYIKCDDVTIHRTD